MRKNDRTGKQLRLIPLILGGYGAILGSGLTAIGFSEITEGIGAVRFVLGLGMTVFGLLGIWDGVRDLVRPDKMPQKVPSIQFILTDISGIRSSNVTPECLREQISILAESEDYKSFSLQILPPLRAGEYGILKQISCVYHDGILLAAFFEMSKDGYRVYQRSTDPDMAEEWLGQLLSGHADFSRWESVGADVSQEEETVRQDETAGGQNKMDVFWHLLLAEQKDVMDHWHQLLVVFGESWHDEHKFFSVRDVELTVEGIHEGKYQKAVLEWGTQAVDLLRGVQNDMMVIWCTDNTGKGNTRFLAREGTVTQVKFWLARYLDRGYFEEMSGWTDVTAQVENIAQWKEKGKGRKKHGKLF